MMDNCTLIAVAAAMSAIDPATPLEDQFRQAARSVKDDWLGHTFDKDGRFAAAVGAVLAKAEEDGRAEDVERIKAEVELLTAINAAFDGVHVDLTRMADLAAAHKPIGMVGIWQETEAVAMKPNVAAKESKP